MKTVTPHSHTTKGIPLDLRDINAGDAFRDTLLARRDAVDGGGYPLWHGWAILDGFMAGAAYARSETGTPNEGYPGIAHDLETMRSLLMKWTGDGHLQTFEDRERFRTEARAALKNAAPHGSQPLTPLPPQPGDQPVAPTPKGNAELLRDCKEKLQLYYAAVNGEYPGGKEYQGIIRRIDAALEQQFQRGET